MPAPPSPLRHYAASEPSSYGLALSAARAALRSPQNF